MQHYWRVWLAAACVKVLLFPSYFSTDFDVHRTWLAVTHARDASQWYADQPSQNQWTLDYPPLFAMYEAILSKVAARVDVPRERSPGSTLGKIETRTRGR